MIAPLLFALSFVLSIFQHNIGELTPKMLIFPLLIVGVLSLIITSVFYFLLRDKTKGVIFSTIFVIIFFSYSQILKQLQSIKLPDVLILSTLIGILIAAFLYFKKSKKKFTKIAYFLQIVSILSVLIPISSIIWYQISQRLHPPITSPLKLPDQKSLSLSNEEKFPDIYYIVPDSYTSETAFKRYFDYDNSQFINFLKSKGFYVAQESASNYPKTFLSITSTLNMEYLDYLSKFKNSSDQTLIIPLVDNNNAARFLKSLGYKYYHLGSWYRPTQKSLLADDNYTIQKRNNLGIDGFSFLIINSSLISPLFEVILPDKIIGESSQDKRSIILYQFETLPDVAKLPGPKFVFVHIIAPHAPYVFGKNCIFTTPKQIEAQTVEAKYTNQVDCISIKLQQAIDSILQSSANSPIILLQSDEGARFVAEQLTPADNWKEADDLLIQMKFPILAAYYLPGKSTSDLYPAISPVNSLRLIFNLYFGTNLPLLPDKSFIFPDTKDLYNFQDITDKLIAQ